MIPTGTPPRNRRKSTAKILSQSVLDDSEYAS